MIITGTFDIWYRLVKGNWAYFQINFSDRQQRALRPVSIAASVDNFWQDRN